MFRSVDEVTRGITRIDLAAKFLAPSMVHYCHGTRLRERSSRSMERARMRVPRTRCVSVGLNQPLVGVTSARAP